jgi:hypothetical protein
MQYMLLIYGDEAAGAQMTEEEGAKLGQAYGEYSKWLADKGWMRAGDALHDTSHATTVRVRGGETVTTDGPFAETKEQLGGYYVLECENIDEALAYAAQIPAAEQGSIEVRPVWEM